MLFRGILAQRLEINAIESALKSTGILADSQIQEIRLKASKAAEVWSRGGTDLLELIRMHSSPKADMLMPLSQEDRGELRREIDDVRSIACEEVVGESVCSGRRWRLCGCVDSGRIGNQVPEATFSDSEEAKESVRSCEAYSGPRRPEDAFLNMPSSIVS